MQQPQQQQQQPLPAYVPLSNADQAVVFRPGRVETFPGMQAIGLGIAMIVIGCLSFALSVVAQLSMFAFPATTVVAGGFGIAAGCRKSLCRMHAFNVLCIVAAAYSVQQFGTSIAFAVIQDAVYQRSCSQPFGCGQVSPLYIINIVLAIVAALQAGAAIWGSVICCLTACCCNCCECCGDGCCHCCPDNFSRIPVGAVVEYNDMTMVVTSKRVPHIQSSGVPMQMYQPVVQPTVPVYDYDQQQQLLPAAMY